MRQLHGRRNALTEQIQQDLATDVHHIVCSLPQIIIGKFTIGIRNLQYALLPGPGRILTIFENSPPGLIQQGRILDN